MPRQRPGALPGDCARRLQLDGLSQLSLGALSIASAVRGHAQEQVAQVAPRQSAALADIHELRTERFHLRKVTEHPRHADPVGEHHERGAEVAQSLGEAQRLVGKARRLLATAEIAVLKDHERLHTTEIPQGTLPLERLGGPQPDTDSFRELGIDEMVNGLHVQHVGHYPLVVHLISKRTCLVERCRCRGIVATYANRKRQR